MKIEFEITKESALVSKLAIIKRNKLISIIAQHGYIYFSIIALIGFMLFQMPFASYERLEGTLSANGIWILDKGIYLLISTLIGFTSHRFARRTLINSNRERINRLPNYIFGKRQIILEESGLSIIDPKYSSNYSWYVLEQAVEDDWHLVITALGETILLIPKSAFVDSNEKNQFLDLFRRFQKDDLRIWLEEDKKLTNQKRFEKKTNSVLSLAIVSFIFSIFLIGLVFSFFTLRNIKQLIITIDKSGEDFEKYKRKITIAKVIAVIPLVFWSAILLLYVIILGAMFFG